MAGQTLHDRLVAAKHTIYGQNVERAVCKATTEEIIGPKKKHLDYLIHCTNEPNVSVPELCNFLIQRTQQTPWVMVFKSLITAHHLMCYGNERFIQCMATSSCSFHLSHFVDRAASQGYEMSTFVRRYAKYLNSKASTYRIMGADFCKMKRGKEEGVLRNMSTESLLKTLPILHEQLDALIEFDCNPDDLTNGVMNSCFVLLYRDLIQLFAAYNDGIINLFEKYFTMNKKHCKEALDIYKKFIVAMDKVSDFLKVAERVGIDKGSIPDLTKAPGSLLEEMENHLIYLEGKKTQTTPKTNSIQTAVSALNSTSSAFTNSISSAHEINGLTVDESMRRAVEEEAAVMNQLKEQRLKELASKQATEHTNKVPSPIPPPSNVVAAAAASLSPPTKVKEPVPQSTPESSKTTASNTEDLMSLNVASANNFVANQAAFHQVPFTSMGMEGVVTAIPAEYHEVAFSAAFPSVPAADAGVPFDPFGGMLQPQSSTSPSSTPVPEECESKSSPNSAKLITADLDSSLQTLVQNLDINGPKKPVKLDSSEVPAASPTTNVISEQPVVISSSDNLMGDLLSIDLNAASTTPPPPPSAPVSNSAVDMLGGGLNSLKKNSSSLGLVETSIFSKVRHPGCTKEKRKSKKKGSIQAELQVIQEFFRCKEEPFEVFNLKLIPAEMMSRQDLKAFVLELDQGDIYSDQNHCWILRQSLCYEEKAHFKTFIQHLNITTTSHEILSFSDRCIFEEQVIEGELTVIIRELGLLREEPGRSRYRGNRDSHIYTSVQIEPTLEMIIAANENPGECCGIFRTHLCLHEKRTLKRWLQERRPRIPFDTVCNIIRNRSRFKLSVIIHDIQQIAEG